MWRMGPVGPSDSSRRYLTDSLVLQTTFRTPTGRAELTDALVLGSEDSGHDIGKTSPQLLVRHFAVTEGTVTLDGCLMPRGRFGLSLPQWEQQGDDLLLDIDGERLLLQAPAPQRFGDGQFFWHLTLQAGESATFALGGAPEPGARPLQRTSLESLAQTLGSWRSWSDLHDTYRGAWRDEVRLSGRVLQGLTFSPTGASIAAPTTSLPRRPDGSLNRDYRLVLLEHAAATAAALKVAACTVEADRQVTWLVAAATTPWGPRSRTSLLSSGSTEPRPDQAASRGS
jgi:GH15 family glucan-1,4-alpha-glucosidase